MSDLFPSAESLRVIAPEVLHWLKNPIECTLDGTIQLPDGTYVQIRVTQTEMLHARDQAQIVDILREKVDAAMGRATVAKQRSRALEGRMHRRSRQVNPAPKPSDAMVEVRGYEIEKPPERRFDDGDREFGNRLKNNAARRMLREVRDGEE